MQSTAHWKQVCTTKDTELLDERHVNMAAFDTHGPAQCIDSSGRKLPA